MLRNNHLLMGKKYGLLKLLIRGKILSKISMAVESEIMISVHWDNGFMEFIPYHTVEKIPKVQKVTNFRKNTV